MSDLINEYFLKQDRLQQNYEMLCNRCGACCGISDGDPCSNLKRENDGKYLCGAYNNRLGPQVTITGKPFNCVPIKDVISKGHRYSDCGYTKF